MILLTINAQKKEPRRKSRGGSVAASLIRMTCVCDRLGISAGSSISRYVKTANALAHSVQAGRGRPGRRNVEEAVMRQ
jgi:hypothetical protein